MRNKSAGETLSARLAKIAQAPHRRVMGSSARAFREAEILEFGVQLLDALNTIHGSALVYRYGNGDFPSVASDQQMRCCCVAELVRYALVSRRNLSADNIILGPKYLKLLSFGCVISCTLGGVHTPLAPPHLS